jgi:hypothetical protein
MLLRILAFVVGLLEILVPRQLVDFWMGLAAVDDEVELRPWVYTVARAEGVVLVLWALRRRRGATA